MKTPKAPRSSFRRSATSVPALLALVTLSGTAIAATDIESPCRQATKSSDSLQAYIARGAAITAARTVETTAASPTQPDGDDAADPSSSEAEKRAAADEASAEKAAVPEFTSRLPGIAVNDLPGFRRHMYRTDI